MLQSNLSDWLHFAITAAPFSPVAIVLFQKRRRRTNRLFGGFERAVSGGASSHSTETDGRRALCCVGVTIIQKERRKNSMIF